MSSAATLKLCWGSEAEILMLDFYRDHEQLWNCKHQDYYDRDLRDLTLSELAGKLGCDNNGVPYSVNDIKYKIKNLRATFGRELMKCAASKHNGRAGRYTPRWRHYHRMMFLTSSRKPRESKRQLRNNNNNATDTDIDANANVKREDEEFHLTDNDEVLDELDECHEKVDVDDEVNGDPLDMLCDVEIEEEQEESINQFRPIKIERNESPVIDIDPTRCLDIVHDDHDNDDDDEDVDVDRIDMAIVGKEPPDAAATVTLVDRGGDHNQHQEQYQRPSTTTTTTTTTMSRESRQKQKQKQKQQGQDVVSSTYHNGLVSSKDCCPMSSCHAHQRVDDEDSEYHFCMSLADNLRRMSPYQRQSAKIEMQKVVMRFMFPVYKQSDNEY